MWQWLGYDVTLRQSAQASWDHRPCSWCGTGRTIGPDWPCGRPANDHMWSTPVVVMCPTVYRRQCYFPAAMLYSRIISTNAPTELTWRHSYDVTDAPHSCPSSHAVAVYCLWLISIIDFTVSSVIRSGKSRRANGPSQFDELKIFNCDHHRCLSTSLYWSVLSVCPSAVFYMCSCCSELRMNEWVNEWEGLFAIIQTFLGFDFLKCFGYYR